MANKTFTGRAGGVDINTQTIANGINYGVGFGMGDFRRAMSSGYSAQSVLNYLSGWNNPIAPQALSALAMEASRQSQMKIQPPPTPPPPEPKALTTTGTAVGGSAKGVKIQQSKMANKGTNTRGTRSLNRRQRNANMQINNLNLA